MNDPLGLLMRRMWCRIRLHPIEDVGEDVEVEVNGREAWARLTKYCQMCGLAVTEVRDPFHRTGPPQAKWICEVNARTKEPRT